MNSTGNYQLNQWDPEDRILRTDFNSDNEKIDTALKSQSDGLTQEKAAREELADNLASEISARKEADAALEKAVELQLIQRIVTTEESETVSYDLTDIDWSKWRRVHFAIYPLIANQGSQRFLLHLNASTNGSLVNFTGSSWKLMTVTPLHYPDLLFVGSLDGTIISDGYSYQEVTALVLTTSSSQPFAVGNKLEIWGEA